MYKALVVDDEVFIRKGIINAIQWSNLGLELVGEAEDGYEAIEKAEILRPDIVVMDMRMPGMDGIGLIQALKNKIPAIKLIVISAYSDFEYTRWAIINKAFDYLLKPVKKEELNNILEKCIAEINDDKKKSEESKIIKDTSTEIVVKQLLFDEISKVEEYDKNLSFINERLQFPHVICAVSKMDDITEARSVYKDTDFFGLIKETMEEELKKITGDKQIVIINKAEAEVVSLFSLKDNKDNQVISILQNIINKIKDKKGFNVSTGAGEFIASPEELCNNYRQVIRVLKTKDLSQRGRVLYRQNAQREEVLETGFISYSSKLLINSIRSGDKEKSIKIFKNIIKQLLVNNVTVYLLHKSMVNVLGEIEKELNAMNTAIDIECGKNSIIYVKDIMSTYSTCEIEELFGPVINRSCDFFAAKCKKGGKKIVEEVIKSINNNYAEPISIFSYAKQYYLNPDYLGRVFKNVTGKSFVDYLTNIRIEKAKELIDKGICTHYYEVASCVGYDDYSYFCKVFKIVTGLTPGEFKDKI